MSMIMNNNLQLSTFNWDWDPPDGCFFLIWYKITPNKPPVTSEKVPVAYKCKVIITCNDNNNHHHKHFSKSHFPKKKTELKIPYIFHMSTSSNNALL